MPISVPNKTWFDLLTQFTGLEVHSCESSQDPVLKIIGDTEVLVDGQSLRIFDDKAHMQVWLLLTISDVMVQRGALTLCHAASFLYHEQAILISGPPFSGKSTWAFSANRPNLVVLGDDQIGVDINTGMFFGIPRPLKRRMPSRPDEIFLSSNALYTDLDGESIALEPLGMMAQSRLECTYSASLIVQVRRHVGSGIRWSVPPAFEIKRNLLNELRCYHPDLLLQVAKTVRILEQLPIISMSVGDGQTSQALNKVLEIVDRNLAIKDATF